MAAKKNKKSNQAKLKKSSSKKSAPKKKVLAKKSAARKRTIPRKNVRARGKSENVATATLQPEELESRSGGQAGDLQGLSSTAGADSESVDELLEEGNAFEAEVLEGVQDSPDADRGEVTTHEVPEDDVPEEYLNKDQ